MRSTGEAPSAQSADEHERVLAIWRHDQSHRLKVGSLPPDRERYLDTVAPGWRPTPRRGMVAFRTRADELGQWMRSTGRVPSRPGEDAQERRLSGWRYRQLEQLTAGTLPPEREEYLDTVAPGWRPTPTSTPVWFRAQAEDLGRWFASADNRLPSVHSDDPHEQRLARWRGAQLVHLRARTLPPERQQYLDQVAPGWRPHRLTGVEGFRSRAEALGQWLSSGVVPSRRSDDPYERRLGVWRQKQPRALRDGTLPLEQEHHLDEVAPGWRSRARDTAAEFPARARALGRWMVWSDGKVPDGDSDDWYERRLRWWRSVWLARLRTGTLPSEHEEYLDEVAPGWRPRAGSGIDEFPDRAVALGQWFAAADGRLPSFRSDDLHERRLERWRRGWLFHLRNGTLSPEHEQYLDQVAPGWRPRRADQAAHRERRPLVDDARITTR